MAKRPTKNKVHKLEDFDPLDQALATTMGSTPPAVITSLQDFLTNEVALIEASQLIASGSSVGTLEMTLGLNQGQLETWLRTGQKERDGPFRALYLWYTRAASVPRSVAESSMLAKSPDKWLQTVDIRGILNRAPETQDDLPNNTLDGSVSDKPLMENGLEYAEFDEDDLSEGKELPKDDDETPEV